MPSTGNLLEPRAATSGLVRSRTLPVREHLGRRFAFVARTKGQNVRMAGGIVSRTKSDGLRARLLR